MKSIIKLMVVFVCVVSLVACGRKDTTVSANKDGVLYEAGVGVSFYYPSDFKLSEGNPNDGVTRFTKENQILFLINNSLDKYRLLSSQNIVHIQP